MKKAVLVNYNHDPKDWWLDYGYKPEDVIVYDRSDDGTERTFQAKVIRTENVGQVDLDKLTFLVENYDSLPDHFLWAKTNLWKYTTREEYEKVKDNKTFTPLLTQSHKTYSDNNGPVCYYAGGIYYERNNNWFFNQFQSKHVNSYSDWARIFQLPNPSYLPFAPGGNYILTKEKVHKYSRDFYENMASMLPYCREPVEAQCAERSYYNMWI
jgi:hypothetical protein